MAENNYSFDKDFAAINSLFEDYAKSVDFVNVKDFKSATKTKLTECVWNMLYKNPKNRYDMEHNAADFVIALNSCLNACLKKMEAGSFLGTFSQYIYNTIPSMIKNDPDAKKPARTDAEINKIKKVHFWYEDFQKRGTLTHAQIIKKISILMGLSESLVDNYVKSNLYNTSSDALYGKEDGEESDNTSIDLELGVQNDSDNPESEYDLLTRLEDSLESLNTNWLIISDEVEKKCLSDLLTEFILRSYKTSFQRDDSVHGLSQISVDFDIAASCDKYEFLNRRMVEIVLSSEDKSLPGQLEIGRMYYPDIKKDTVNHKVKRFIAKAVENLK